MKKDWKKKTSREKNREDVYGNRTGAGNCGIKVLLKKSQNIIHLAQKKKGLVSG